MSKSDILRSMKQSEERFTNIAKKIWENPQIAYEEEFAADLQMKVLREAGFSVQNPIGDIKTAFVAEYGEGHPIVGVLGEFDALPGLSQEVNPTKTEVIPGGPGHGCGHNLLGTAGIETVIALKEKMKTDNISGTIRYYGCPAEEVLSGKTYMAKEGVFDDLDIALTWHPSTSNTVINMSMQAMVSVRFQFKGITAHAAAAPHAGRSALDSVEIMNVGANYLREHVKDGTRIHYTITDGGLAPNVVPEHASVWYYIRADKMGEVKNILERMKNIAQGAALMNETEVEWEIDAFPHETLTNEQLNDLMYENMEASYPLKFTEQEEEFAQKLMESTQTKSSTSTFGKEVESLLPTNYNYNKQMTGKTLPGSTDVGDVSFIVPTGFIGTTCAPVGTQLHTWQATATFGSTIGFKGMHLAAQVMALTGYDILLNKDNIIEKAKEEFNELTKGKEYAPGF